MSMETTYLERLYQAGDRWMLCVLGGLMLLSCALAPWYHTWPEVIAIGVPSISVTACWKCTSPCS